MATVSQFYPSKQDSNLSKDIWFRSFDMHISKWEYEGPMVYELTGTLFTPAVSPAWAVDALASTELVNFYFVDDNGDLCAVKVASNTATAITAGAGPKKVKDGTTAAALTDAATYECYVLTGNNKSAHGDYAGYTILGGFAPGIETMDMVTGVPETKIRKDVAAVKPVLKGALQVIGVPALKTLMRLKEYGLQTGQTSLYTGQAIDIGGSWQVKLVGKNVNGQTIVGRYWKTALSMDGELNLGAKEYKTIGFMADILQNQYVEDPEAGLYGWEITD